MTEETQETEIKEEKGSGVTEGAKPLAKEKTEPETEKQEETPKVKSSEKDISKTDKDNTIFIGIKPFMNYVTGVVIQFKNKNQKEVIVSARGKFISKAVDVVEVAKRTFLKEENIQIKDIKISSEAFENKEGKKINVSAIEIILIKPD